VLCVFLQVVIYCTLTLHHIHGYYIIFSLLHIVDNTLDQNAIIDFHPEMDNVLMVNGFSGHGLQHSPAAGRAAAELITCDGRFATLDLSIFGFGRCCENRPVFEQGIV